MKEEKYIMFKTKLDQDFIEKLLYYLWEEGETGPTERTTFLGLADGMNINIQNEKELEKLRLHLWYLEKEEYLEERRYTYQIGLIDYSLEPRASTEYYEEWVKRPHPPLVFSNDTNESKET